MINERWPIEDSSGSDEDAGHDSLKPQTCEFEDLLASIEETNTRLRRLSLVTDSPDIPQAWEPVLSSDNIDYTLVAEKFPYVSPDNKWLLERLARLVTARRRFLKDQQSMGTMLKFKASIATPSEPLYKRQREEDSVLPSTQNWESFENVEQTLDRSTIKARKLFQCPYCWNHIKIVSQSEWERHVSTDLNPYICTFRGCSWRLFSDCDAWFLHELQHHRREWICQQCQVEPFATKEAFQHHLILTHELDISSSYVKGILIQSEEPLESFGQGACLLCAEWDPMACASKLDLSAETFKRHLACHLKEVVTLTVTEDRPLSSNIETSLSQGRQDVSTHDKYLDPPSRFLAILNKIENEVSSLSMRPSSQRGKRQELDQSDLKIDEAESSSATTLGQLDAGTIHGSHSEMISGPTITPSEPIDEPSDGAPQISHQADDERLLTSVTSSTADGPAATQGNNTISLDRLSTERPFETPARYLAESLLPTSVVSYHSPLNIPSDSLDWRENLQTSFADESSDDISKSRSERHQRNLRYADRIDSSAYPRPTSVSDTKDRAPDIRGWSWRGRWSHSTRNTGNGRSFAHIGGRDSSSSSSHRYRSIYGGSSDSEWPNQSTSTWTTTAGSDYGDSRPSARDPKMFDRDVSSDVGEAGGMKYHPRIDEEDDRLEDGAV